MSRQFTYVCRALEDPVMNKTKPLPCEIYILVGETEINRQIDVQWNVDVKHYEQK